jgi:hypothetical protein
VVGSNPNIVADLDPLKPFFEIVDFGLKSGFEGFPFLGEVFEVGAEEEVIDIGALRGVREGEGRIFGVKEDFWSQWQKSEGGEAGRRNLINLLVE